MENSKVKVAVHIAASRYYVNCGDAQSIQIEKVFSSHEKAAAYIKKRGDFMYEVQKRDRIARKLRDDIHEVLMRCCYREKWYNKDEIKSFGIKPEDYISEKTFDGYDYNWQTDIAIMKEVYDRFKYLILKFDPDLPELTDKDFPYIHECNTNDDFRNYGSYEIWEEKKLVE